MKKHIFEQLTKLVYDDVTAELILDLDVVRPHKHKHFNRVDQQQLLIEESVLNLDVIRSKKKRRRLNFNFLLQQFDLDIPIFDMPTVRPYGKHSRLNLSFLQDQFVVYPTPLPTLISFMSKFHAPWGGQQ